MATGSFEILRIGVLMAGIGGLGVGLATTEGCGSTSGPSTNNNGDLVCNECDQYAYKCTNKGPVCAPDDITAGVQLNCQSWTEKKDCTGNSGGSGGADGGSGGQGSSCGTWDPDALVAYNRNTREFEVDQQLLDDLETDLTVLDCDSARARILSGGYYQMHSMGRDDLSFHLGLRNGDVIKAVNGYDLETPDDYLAAYTALKGTTTSFDLEVVRGGVTITVNYEIV